ncbi:MAG TPA: hypothetical protein VIF82_01165 [Burkholderiaceae bacterium]|jgi:hypothetical protein
MQTARHNYQVQNNTGDRKTLSLENGLAFSLDGHGNMVCELPFDVTIGIKNIGEVLSHTVNSIVNSHSHVLHFANGGLLRYAYNDAGELIDLYCEKLSSSLNSKNEVVFSII